MADLSPTEPVFAPQPIDAALVLIRELEDQNRQLLAVLKNLAKAYRARVPSLLSTDLCFATLLEAEDLIRRLQ